MSQPDLVVLVHGTFAGAESDVGDKWWQRESECWNSLRARLPEGVELPDDRRLFRWSGENSERERVKASYELLEHLQELEADGLKYHLVGHSHGGSVIWGALRLATLQNIALPGLASWATVGTPFLHLRSRNAFSAANILNSAVALVFLVAGFRRLCKFLYTLGRAIVDSEYGVDVWNFKTGQGQPFLEYVFLTPEGWLLLGLTLGAIFLFLQLGGLFLGPVVEARRMQREARLEERAMALFGDRWLGLWSPDDEAILGLRATVNLSLSFVGRITRRDRVFFSDRFNILSGVYHWTVAPTFNWLLRPYLDRAVASYVKKSAQGNNRPAADVVDVSVAPLSGDDLATAPSIPDVLNRKIVDRANQHATNLVPQLRTLLGEASFVNGMTALGSSFSGKELVHTSYFDHDEVLELLAMHIAKLKADDEFLWRRLATHPDLLHWLRGFHERAEQSVATISLSRRQRRAAEIESRKAA